MKIPVTSTHRYWMPFDIRNRQNPYPMYHRLRLHEPLHYDEWSGIWITTSYETVKRILSDPTFETTFPWNTFNMSLPYLYKAIPAWLLLTEGTTHKKLRSIAKEVISWQGLDEAIQEVINTNIFRLKKKNKIDIINEYALLTPVNIITKILGLPLSDAPKFKAWAGKLIWATSPYVTPNMYRELDQNAKAFIHYLKEFIKVGKSDHLISKLLNICDENDQYLSEEEVISFIIFLFLSGEETVVNFIGNGVNALLNHPVEREELKKCPEKLTLAIEELLRYDTPLQHSVRVAAKDIIIDGKMIKKGKIILPVMGAANRDPSVFQNPDQLNFNRQKLNHLSFGVGRHYCFGARLARMESKYAIQAFLEHLDDFTIDKSSSLRYNKNIMFRGLQNLNLIKKS